MYRALDYKAVPRFGEFCSCCCLPLLPQLARSILATWERPYRDSLYMGSGIRRRNPGLVSGMYMYYGFDYLNSPASLDINYSQMDRRVQSLDRIMNDIFSATYTATPLRARICVCCQGEVDERALRVIIIFNYGCTYICKSYFASRLQCHVSCDLPTRT